MKSFGLCLSAGGAKGQVHVGVIEQLLKHKIKIQCIAGTSMGAIIGADLALHGNVEASRKFMLSLSKGMVTQMFAKDMNWFSWLNPFNWRSGMCSGDLFEENLTEIIPRNARFEDCIIPISIIAMNYETREESVFKTGSLLDAVRASISMAFTFEPVQIDGQIYVDGGYINPAPVDTCREMGADKVILSGTFPIQPEVHLVDSGRREKCRFVGSPMKVLQVVQNHVIGSLIRVQAKEADIYIEPKVESIDVLEFWKGRRAMDSGRLACKAKMKDIKRLSRLWL